MNRNLKQALLRKSRATLNKLPRAVDRLRTKTTDYANRPPVIVNSLPKSGTHLLIQIALALPGTRHYGSFIAQRASYSIRTRSQTEIEDKIDRILPGEVIAAHLHYTRETAKCLSAKNALHLFIYRDPRAVVVSEAHYLTHMAPWNALYKHFAAADGPEAQITLAIKGNGTNELPCARDRYSAFLNWHYDPEVVSISYEDLISPKSQEDEISRIIQAYEKKTGRALNDSEVNSILSAVQPIMSHTFTGKDPDRWRSILNPAQIAELEEQFIDSWVWKRYQEI